MKIKHVPSEISEIVAISEKLKKINNETDRKILMCQRGINSVCNIDLSRVISNINFNSADLQTYPNNSGRIDLRKAINDEYFQSKASIDNIQIINGGIAGIDISCQLLDVESFVLPRYFWGAYIEIFKMRNVNYSFYNDLEDIKNRIEDFKNKAIIICDPNNPLGNKYNDNEVIEIAELLNKNNITVIFDCPYRRVFYNKDNDNLFTDLLRFDNAIIVDSFSKSLGLSGLRIGFIHSSDKNFNTEAGKIIMYQTNGINTFSQLLIKELLTSDEGRLAVAEFKDKTVNGIKENIDFLRRKKLLAEQFYINSEPMGIFAVVNKSEEELLNYNIGSVSLAFFTREDAEASKFARICVSMPPAAFQSYFDKIE